MSDDKLATVVTWLRDTAKRDGQVSIEAVAFNYRADSTLAQRPLAGDILQTGFDLYSRIRNYFTYSAAANYHAKLLYNPFDQSVMYVYFVHRRYGDLCQNLYSHCDVIEYVDDELFDKTLSQRLNHAAKHRQAVRVVFHKTEAFLPEFELTLDRYNKTSAALRLYKWFVASADTIERTTSKERFIGLETAVAAIKYSLQVYDIVQAIELYQPARSMQAEIVYSQNLKGKQIQSVVFYPSKP